jgi:flagellar hook assembly protein FlgD
VSRNVFHPETDVPPVTINMHLSLSGPCFLRVYNTAGELVRTLVSQTDVSAPKDISVSWDGTNDKGQKVASGVYVLHFMSTFESKTAKLLVVR